MIGYSWYFDKVCEVETFQSQIDDLYTTRPILKDKIRRLKIKRDKLLLQIENDLNSEDWEGEEDEYYLRKALFKDRNVPIGRSYYDRWPGEENAEATDWEYDEVEENLCEMKKKRIYPWYYPPGLYNIDGKLLYPADSCFLWPHRCKAYKRYSTEKFVIQMCACGDIRKSWRTDILEDRKGREKSRRKHKKKYGNVLSRDIPLYHHQRQFAQKIHDELLPIAWHPDRVYDWCFDEEQKQTINWLWN